MSHRIDHPERDERPSGRGRRKQTEQTRASGIRRGGRRPDLLLERALDEFLYHHQQVSSSRTVAAYAGHLGVFYTWLSEHLGRTPLLSDLTLEIVDIWSRNLSQRPRRLAAGLVEGDGPIAWETRRTYLRTLRTFSNWLPCPPHCFCTEPPLKHLLLPRASDTYKMPLSEQELARLVAATREDSIRGARDTALLLALIDGGLRAMEVARLRIGDVTLESGLLLIAHGKGNRSRVVTLGNDARGALRRYAAIRDSQPGTSRAADAPFFPAASGRFYAYAGLRSWLRRLADRAGVPRAHLHLFRHTSAVDTLDVGGDLRTLQLKLGHTSITTTQRYLNMGTQRLSERQRQFSPVDHLRLLQEKPIKDKPSLPRWRRSDRSR